MKFYVLILLAALSSHAQQREIPPILHSREYTLDLPHYYSRLKILDTTSLIISVMRCKNTECDDKLLVFSADGTARQFRIEQNTNEIELITEYPVSEEKMSELWDFLDMVYKKRLLDIRDTFIDSSASSDVPNNVPTDYITIMIGRPRRSIASYATDARSRKKSAGRKEYAKIVRLREKFEALF